MKFSKTFLITLALSLVAVPCLSQEDEDWDFDEEDDGDKPVDVFYDTRVINGHSVEGLDKGTLDFRITHRFGDIATPGSPRSLFGLDNSTDIRIAFEYGVIDNLTIGAGRSKGSGPLRELWDGFAKYKILTQGKSPLSLSVCLSGFATSMLEDENPASVTSFTKTAHRFSYYSQLIAAIKLGERWALQLAPGYSHRNLVANEDQNGIFAVGAAMKFRFWGKASFVAEYYHLMRNTTNILGTDYYNPLGLGVEIKTHAHVFQMHFMNSEGIGETQFIPTTASDWLKGEFRWGFTISRQF